MFYLMIMVILNHGDVSNYRQIEKKKRKRFKDSIPNT